MNEIGWWLVLLGLAVMIVLQLVLLLRGRGNEDQLRAIVLDNLQSQRSEMGQGLTQFQQIFSTQLSAVASQQNQQIDSFSLQLARFGEQQQARIRELTELNERRLGEIRSTLEQKIKDLQTDNSAKLEQMRHTVDERLHATLEQRLGESFKLVSDRLEAVQRGLGEMQSLAQGVGDLKRVLTNVKTRGTWGEVQLDQLLEQILTQDQYAKNVATKPGSRDHVEFALRLPGQNGQGVWLPIDAKFPVEDYERLLSAHERADLAGVEEAAKALETRLKTEGRVIRDKYLSPPHTTEFALLYLPTEGLYAEALRRPGLTDFLQREYRVTVAGPTTLTAMLNALQMGFKTLAIEKRSSEVWALLGSVKTEFGKFGDLLAKSKAQLQTVLNTMDSAESKTRTIERKLRDVEQLPVEQQHLGLDTQPE
ncbi:MAG: DNA recombination protein RmuC [Burkholderiales bacterium]|jgi:DNA recombination protein RmuC|nr:DNA recombination protein RmuC [Burkholderiales bacterium]MCA3160610.1 DNA recombination protein RmuC [Burkholderiales bacterium]MCA3163193.1 DNA recombination protein RmuC [Burkholderiales bacterium]MCA3166051.1 DNA recombination protein RmuC [Burkholderiales bacterium]MCA3171045.1 DNA recombination protein RmuC [Burkholderiales bacterium]